jgi:hypothetical protein
MATTSKRSTAKRHVVHAATLLPLAIGLAGNLATPPHTGGPTAVTETTASAVSISCVLPFDSIKQTHPIDNSCGSSGNAKENTPQALQNQAKNNFCSSGVPVNVAFDDLRQLQNEAAGSVTFGGDNKLPNDRSLLHSFSFKGGGTIGEGKVVRIAAFVIDAHYSNVGIGKGESVNCKLPNEEDNDIHIVLGEKSNRDAPCSSVTAEMSPHFRPVVWTPDALNQHNQHLFRFTGQLFFDASHSPCTASSEPNPKRSTLWEIHPVYEVDICIDPENKCTVDKDLNWEPLSEFMGAGTTETVLRKPFVDR